MKHLRNRKIYFVSSLVASVTLCSSVVAQMQDLGPGVYPHVISGDGSVVAGEIGGRLFRWTEGFGMEFLSGPNTINQVRDVSYDGSVMVGDGAGGSGFVWSEARGFRNVNGFWDVYVNAVSSDGQYIYGGYEHHEIFPPFDGVIPCVWTAATLGRSDLGGGHIPLSFPVITATSGDGIVLFGLGWRWDGTYNDGGTNVGYYPMYFRWTPAAGPEVLQRADSQLNQPSSVSQDGTVFVGGTKVWQSGGLSDFGGGFRGEAVSKDGTLFAGTISSYGNSRAARRTDDGADQVLWNGTSSAADMSAGGSAIVGVYSVDGANHGFVWTADRDRDGLLDDWESKQGIDIDGNGTIDVELKGANPDRKDIFIEVDLMAGIGTSFQELDRKVFSQVRRAFRNAPVPNVGDEPEGINVHFEPSDNDLPAQMPLDQATAKLYLRDGKEFWFGDGRLKSTLDTLEVAKRKAKKRAYRYLIIGDDAGEGRLGVTENIYPAGSIVYVNHPSIKNDQLAQARSVMHELGHTLGLHHGGNWHQKENGKPNYVSVMNYSYQPSKSYAGKPITQGWVLDYSRQKLTLDEDELNEIPGQSLRYSANPSVAMIFSKGKFTAENPRRLAMAHLDGRGVDWDGDDLPTKAKTQEDLNYWIKEGSGTAEWLGWTTASPGQKLEGHDDWKALVINPRGPIQGSVADDLVSGCPTSDRIDWLRTVVPDYAALQINVETPAIDLPARQGVIQMQELPNGVVESIPVTINEMGTVFTPVPREAGQYRIQLLDKGALSASTVITVQPEVSQSIDLPLYYGDIDADNTISLFDYLILQEYFDKNLESPDWYSHLPGGFAPDDADLDCDGVVGLFDYLILSENFGRTGS